MIPRLILRHEILHTLTKPLLITVTVVSLIMNLLAFQMAKSHSEVLVEGSRAVLAQFAFLAPVILILAMGKADNRCRPWEAGLPLGSRSLWWAYLGALSLGILWLMSVAGVFFVGFASLMGMVTHSTILRFPEMVALLVRPASASLAAACLVATWSPQSGRLSEAAGWERLRIAAILVAVALTGFLVQLPPVFALVPVAAGLLWALRTGSVLAPAMDLGGDSAAGEMPGLARAVWLEVEPSRRVVRKMFLRILFKWPLSWLALGPIAALFGLMMSGSRVLGMDDAHLRFTNFFLVVYILFTMSNHFMENLYKVDHLPLDRRALLRWLVVPVVLAFVAGYGAGRMIEFRWGQRVEEMVFDNGQDNYGLKIPPRVWKFALTPDPRVATAPWGESHDLQSVPVLQGLPMVLWKPYTTPADASREFVAWQISRAAAEVHGLAVTPEEIADRYLETDLYGKTTMRPGGLTLMADHPRARSAGSGPVFPLLVGAEIAFLMMVYGFFFRAFKPGVTIRKTRIVFWSIMGGLMALHVGGYILIMKGVTRDWIAHGFWMGRIREIGSSGPGGIVAAWAAAVVLLALAWRRAETAFLEAEAPSR